MAGASDPLEDMLFNEVDEKAVSDLVGSLESQLGQPKATAASYSAGKRDGAAAAASHFSGKVRDQEPQQGHLQAALKLQSSAGELLPSSTSSGGSTALVSGGGSVQTFGQAPTSSTVLAPGIQTLSTQPAAASFNRAAEPSRTASPGLQSLNGNAAAVKLQNSTGVAPPATAGGSLVMAANFHPGSQSTSPATPLQRLPSPTVSIAQNGLDPKGGQLVSPGGPSPSPVVNHNKILVPGQPAAGNSVILTGNPPPALAQSPVMAHSPVTQPQSVAGPSTAAAKLAVNGLGQAGLPVVRPAGAPAIAGALQPQRPGLVPGTTRLATPQPPLAVRPQQQATIQLPPGFTMPAGMVLVRIETGQLVMVPQQVLAQAQAKTQQSPTVTNIAQRPATPTATAAIRVSTTPSTPGTPQNIRLATPTQTRLVPSPSSSSTSSSTSSAAQAITVGPSAPAVSVMMTPPPKAPTVIAAEAAPVVKSSTPPVTAATPAQSATPTTRVTVVSQEMQENVKKCKNFLAMLIKLASNNSPSPDTSKNVKALVQDLLDAKIEPEEFTSRLQAELKSSPQPYLIPFLKKTLPALRQSLLSSQQSLTTPAACVPPPVAPIAGTTAAIRPRLPVSPTTGAIRMNAPLTSTTLVAGRAGVQTLQTRPSLVVGQTVRPQGTLIRGPAGIVGKNVVNLAAQANQKKVGDPGGGTFRDDDDINDVASMAGVNLSEENARILATSSELVGTKIRSCKDESFLPAGLLHRRILDTARKLGVSEVPLEVVNLVSHATQSRLRSVLEKVSMVAQHRAEGAKDEDHHEQTSDVRSQLRFFEQLERLEKQRKDEQEREILLKAAKSRARQEDPEQARLKQKAKEMQQQELAQMRQRDANLTALAAIGPRKKRKLDSPGRTAASTEVPSGGSPASSRQQLRQRITRVNLRDLIVCLEQDGSTARSLTLYKALLK
ncbi:transcription initiation factor TFIID subunit 4-like [Dunckerocampus dactyliophorus]|uniref:transcription initiation factor TFIID subunit 4-like n=1 Tax=Dunckerocampus dactyliophorus TaxID=161453 RepID=UPI002404EF13|nr:transcription initiation factor TFIID subunit 4-like [Dunckerocampus dactyliophorus]